MVSRLVEASCLGTGTFAGAPSCSILRSRCANPTVVGSGWEESAAVQKEAANFPRRCSESLKVICCSPGRLSEGGLSAERKVPGESRALSAKSPLPGTMCVCRRRLYLSALLCAEAAMTRPGQEEQASILRTESWGREITRQGLKAARLRCGVSASTVSHPHPSAGPPEPLGSSLPVPGFCLTVPSDLTTHPQLLCPTQRLRICPMEGVGCE